MERFDHAVLLRHALNPGIRFNWHCLNPFVGGKNMVVNEIAISWRLPVIKLDLVNQIVERTGVSKTKAEQAVDTIFNCMKDALKANDRIELRGFGVFSVKPRKTGIGRNPRTGSEVNIPPGKAVRFKPGKDLQSL